MNVDAPACIIQGGPKKRVTISNDARQLFQLSTMCIGEWRRRFAAVVQQNDGHIEHKFQTLIS